MKRKATPVKAWAIMDGDKLAQLYISDHRLNIYDERAAARYNLRVFGAKHYRVSSVEIREVKK